MGESAAQPLGDVAAVRIGATSPAASPLARVQQHVRHARTGSFQRWREQMQRAWKWGPVQSDGEGNGEVGDDDEDREYWTLRTTVNIEMLANQKRQWYQIHSKSKDRQKYVEPTSLFEHFFVVGLHSYANADIVEDAFAKRKAWESNVAKSELLDLRKVQYHGYFPTLEPQILFKYPTGQKVDIKDSDLPAFCFPEGVKARIMERTPSLSDLNEMVFGQDHLARDDVSFIFFLKGSDNTPLYGVCLHIQEIVQRAPSILGAVSPLCHNKLGRFLVSAPRCYCLLTRLPFFELHFEMLSSIIAQERLGRITQFSNGMSLAESITHPLENDEHNGSFESPKSLSRSDWMECAIPVDSVSGIVSTVESALDGYVPSLSFRNLEPRSPESICTSENSDANHLKELEKETRRAWQLYNDCPSETSESRSDSFERVIGTFESGHTSPEVGTAYLVAKKRLERAESLESFHSSVGLVSDQEDDFSSRSEPNVGDEKVMEWAKANNNDSLQIVCGYHALPLPPWGGDIVFHPLEHLQVIKYSRPVFSCLGLEDMFTVSNQHGSAELNAVRACIAAAEEAHALSKWTVATVCRSLSLESVLALFAGALLEKQVVVICPNLGVLSSIVLSTIPMLQPFEWQSLLLPVLPRKMVEFIDAPVPFIVGVQHKPTEVKMRSANLIQINVFKDQVKTRPFPQLPRYKELLSDLSPIHAALWSQNPVAKRHPVYKCSEVQAEAAERFLKVLRRYLESLCSDIRYHTITSVQSNNDKVSLLLKESFIDSFATKDRPFIKLLVETQLFSVLSDSRLSRYENDM